MPTQREPKYAPTSIKLLLNFQFDCHDMFVGGRGGGVGVCACAYVCMRVCRYTKLYKSIPALSAGGAEPGGEGGVKLYIKAIQYRKSYGRKK